MTFEWRTVILGAGGAAAASAILYYSSNAKKKAFVLRGSSHADFNAIYDVERQKLGEGSYASVSKATKKATGDVRALKVMNKGHMKNLDRFREEVNIMALMDHPNILKLYETFEDHRNIYLLQELCTGGELFDVINDQGTLSEVEAATVMQQVFSAISYMHENHVCHRDLKPENLLFLKKPALSSALKLIDFGLSHMFEENQVLTTKAGTPYYIAPEVLAGKHDHMCDLWSCGVIMYVLLCGSPPFDGETDAEVLSKVRLGSFSFDAEDWEQISEDAKSLVCMLLKMNPRERFSAKLALNQAWTKNRALQVSNWEMSETLAPLTTPSLQPQH